MEKKFKLGVLSPYPEFSELVLRICREFDGVEITVEEKVSTEGVEVVREWQREGLVEAVVARNPLARVLAGRVDLPVSVVEITEFDIITALHRARTRYGDPVGFFGCRRGPAEYDFELIREILGFNFQVYLYRDNKDQIMEAFRRDGIKSVTADVPSAVSVARACGINADLVHSGYGPVRQAVASAISMAGLRRDGRHAAGRMESILYSINDGVLALDQDGKVFFCNPVAEKLLGLKPGDVPGRNTGLLHGKEVLKRIYQDGERIRGELVRLETGKELMVNRVKVHAAGGECLVISFQVVSNIRQMEVKIRQKLHARGMVARYRFSDICGSSRLLQEAIDQAIKYARSRSTIIITGESGTGKELFAQSIHNECDRRNGPFVALNCAALPETLLESELFGYEEGAFTGAKRGGKQGLFEIAHGGTIFLDEITELGHQIQGRLLRVIQQKEVMRVGGERVVPVDVRIITATNRNLFEAVQKGTFREDLYYRLNVLPLKIPPLRSRPEDIPELFRYFLNNRGNSVPRQAPEYITEKMKSYSWPGNVRELENFAERYCAIGEEDFERFTTLKGLISRLMAEDGTEGGLKHQIMVELGTFDQIESQVIEQLANLFPNSKGDLARALGISRTTLWRKLKASGCQFN